MNPALITRSALEKTLRSALERAVIKARDIAENAAQQALTRLAVGNKQAPDYFTDQQRALRNRLRAHGRQLGDIRNENGEQTIHKLVTEVAYEHWHRMLFARFLEQNGLLMYDQHTSVTLKDCNELVEEGVFQDALEQVCVNGWELAGVLASKMLPQIFRTDSPVFQLQFALELQRELEKLVLSLSPEVFQAQDSLGWVYQFWQSKRKEEVNRSEVKIGADELSPVTQLFTEPYMVSFLLDNSLGAWWAGKRLSDSDWQTAASEQELREKAAIPGVSLNYLRFIKENDRWQPASGSFSGWPESLSELKTIDPCCGSGHFLVAAFLMLVPMRIERDGVSAKEAIDLVLAQNLHGLELDQRCVELAAFAVALEAWRYPNGGGYRQLPELHLACSGLSISAAKEEWKELSKKAGKQNLTIALDWMYQTFKDAPVLGSLINPKRSQAAKIAQWDELDGALNNLLVEDERMQAQAGTDIRRLSEEREAGIVAQGLVKAAKLLSMQYSWVITNVPYKKTGDLVIELRQFLEAHYSAGSASLETSFYERCMEFCSPNGVTSIVLPQNWMFLKTYAKFREKILYQSEIHSIARLGAGAFETISGEVVKAILITSTIRHKQVSDYNFTGYDVSKIDTAAAKQMILKTVSCCQIRKSQCLESPDSRILMDDVAEGLLLMTCCGSFVGLQNGDTDRFVSTFWQVPQVTKQWALFQMPTQKTLFYSGLEGIVRWESGKGALVNFPGAYIKGKEAWGKNGVCIRSTVPNPVTLYKGNLYDQSSAALIPKKETDLAAIWEYSKSDEFRAELEKIDQKRNKTNGTFVKVSFNKDFWIKIAEDKYPRGLPKPFTNDPTQWIFHGHPCGSVVWDEHDNWTADSDLRIDNTVLQVAVARLLGYQWPAELDHRMELSEEQRAWIVRCSTFSALVDKDGIVCLPAIWGEEAAENRLEKILEMAYADAWTVNLKNQLLKTVGSNSLAAWLRDKFFEQHCNMFQSRPFIWQIWDGLKDGFSVLVNYHLLNKAGLERLIYTYLGDWIRTQQVELANGEDGADVRLAAAMTLKAELEKILQGEKPYDIFVRWKPLNEQPMGWEPDLSDGVRLNIRPFMMAKDMGKKGAGLLRWQPNIKWNKDRGTDVESAPWYQLGPLYGEKEGARINEHHLTLDEKLAAREISHE